MTTPNKHIGFTIVELLVVIVVIAIIAAITTATYAGVQDRAKTDSGQTLASQVVRKAEAYWSVTGNYPDIGQIKNIPTSIPEAKIDNPDSVMTGISLTSQRTETPYEQGTKVLYRRPAIDFGCVLYWDYTENTHKAITFGSGAFHSNCS